MPSELFALSPLDGRYAAKLEALRWRLSEFALIRARVEVELRWFLHLSRQEEVTELPRPSPEDEAWIERLWQGFEEKDAAQIKRIEAETNHDVKAVEYWIKSRFAERPSLARFREFVHFGCTSEDVNNLAYALMLRAARDLLLADLDALLTQLVDRAERWADAPMLARTHGQPATPTTMGKEWAVFALRTARLRRRIERVAILGKMGGATGNFNAHCVAYPELDWPKLARAFVEEELGLAFNPITTQIEPHDWIAELLDAHAGLAAVLIDFARDVWGYVSLGYFRQRLKEGEVGSSTMPHKVNPIDFENAEGNLKLARGLLRALADELPISRWQRDLSDSTMLRNLGVALGHVLLAIGSLRRGIEKLELDSARLQADLDDAWEVLAEAVQTVMRRYGMEEPYEQLKRWTRGKKVDREQMKRLIASLALPEEAKRKLEALSPTDYLGLASAIARSARHEVEAALCSDEGNTR